MEPATPHHADALALIHAAAFPPGAQWDAPSIARQLLSPGTFGFIDPEGGMILARTAADESEILTLAIMPEARRRGLATRLLYAAMTEAASRGAACMLLEVAATNAAARALYDSAGFTQAGRRRRYYADGDDALVLRCAFIPPS